MNAKDNTFSAPEVSDACDSARILVVGGDPELRTSIVGMMKQRGHRCSHVSQMDSAQSALSQHRYDVVLIHSNLADGCSLELVELVSEINSSAKAIVFGESVGLPTTIASIRRGAVDVVNMPADLSEFADRMESALQKSRNDRQRDRRIRRLQRICQELDTAREEISDQVDLLCTELVSAYQELSTQLEDVAMAAEFRTLIRQELDVEDVLRTSLEFLLTKTGPTNAAVFLPDPDQHYSLGAYVNYDCPRESIDSVLGHLCQAICPQMADEQEIVAFDDASDFADWVGIDDGFFGDSNVLAFSCGHEGECLAVVVLFRGKRDPFPPEMAGTLDTIRDIFAEQLSRLIDIHHRAKPSWPNEADDDGFGDDYGNFDFDDGQGSDYGNGGMAA